MAYKVPDVREFLDINDPENARDVIKFKRVYPIYYSGKHSIKHTEEPPIDAIEVYIGKSIYDQKVYKYIVFEAGMFRVLTKRQFKQEFSERRINKRSK